MNNRQTNSLYFCFGKKKKKVGCQAYLPWFKRKFIPDKMILLNAELSLKRYWRGPRSLELGGRGRPYRTLHCHHQRYWRGPRSLELGEEGDRTERYTVTTRGTGGDRDPWSWGKRETVPNATLSPPEVLAGTEIPGVGGRGRPYRTLHCHHQDDGQRSEPV